MDTWKRFKANVSSVSSSLERIKELELRHWLVPGIEKNNRIQHNLFCIMWSDPEKDLFLDSLRWRCQFTLSNQLTKPNHFYIACICSQDNVHSVLEHFSIMPIGWLQACKNKATSHIIKCLSTTKITPYWKISNLTLLITWLSLSRSQYCKVSVDVLFFFVKTSLLVEKWLILAFSPLSMHPWNKSLPWDIEYSRTWDCMTLWHEILGFNSWRGDGF